MKLIIGFLLLAGCANNADPCLKRPEIDQSKPGVLIIGDSISLGYTPFVRAKIATADVVHSACNDMSSSNGVEKVEEWLAYRDHWKVITFNHGFWDIPARSGPAQSQAVTPTQYAANLRIEAMEIKAHSDHAIFVLSTKVDYDWAAFTNADVDEYNSAAKKVMNELGIEILDLNTVSSEIPNEHDSSNIHWTEKGSQVLAEAVAEDIELNL